MIISIDGPAGSGKSTVARRVAEVLGYRYLDTGAMYRTVALAADRAGVDLDEDSAVAAVAERIDLGFEHEDGSAIATRVVLNGEDVTSFIRTPDADIAVSRVAPLPRLRAIMVERQRAIGEGVDLVAEGRDIGTVVFPHAELKIYLTASLEERARRRHVEQSEHGEQILQQDVADRMKKRDDADINRDTSPLAAADDAIEVDTTGLSIDQVVDVIAALAKERA